MTAGADPAATPPARCVTCSDQGLALRVTAVAADGGATCVAADGVVHRDVATDLVAPVAPGEILLVHAGVALANLGPRP